MGHNMLSANKITPEQRQIIEYPIDKNDLYVEAPAGHGKTSTAMLKAGEIAKSLIESPGQKVLVLTFSKMAVRQIDYEKQNHVPKFLHSKILIKTYHAFYFEIIRHYARYLGFEHTNLGLMTENERKALYLLFKVVHPGLDYSTFSYAQYLNAKVFPPEPITNNDKPNVISTAASFLENYHKREHRLGFVDFPYYTYRSLADSSFTCKLLAYKYPIIFLDEFQNTNDLQWTILRCFIQDVKLVAFADPNQTIHIFRGAGQVIEQFEKERKPVHKPLTVNFRNSSSLYFFAKGIASGRFDVPPPSNVIFHKMEIYRRDKWNLKFDIRKSFSKSIRSIAVLTKTNRDVSELSELLARQTLKTPSINHEVVADDFNSQDRENLVLSMFQLITTCNLKFLVGTASALSACSTSDANYMYYLSQAAEAEKCMPNVITSNPEVPGVLNARTILRSLNPIVEAGIPNSSEECWHRTKLVLQEIGKIQSLPSFCNAFDRVQKEWQLFYDRHSNPTLEKFLGYTLDQRRRKNFLEQRSYLKGVFIMTLHQSQGKQFDAVFIWKCNDGIIPHPEEIRDGNLTPSQYLLYVGITRARHLVRIYYEKNKYTQPSRLIQPYIS